MDLPDRRTDRPLGAWTPRLQARFDACPRSYWFQEVGAFLLGGSMEEPGSPLWLRWLEPLADVHSLAIDYVM